MCITIYLVLYTYLHKLDIEETIKRYYGNGALIYLYISTVVIIVYAILS